MRLWERILNAWHGRSSRLDANAIDNARVEHEAAEQEKHQTTALEPGRSNTDWTYVAPG